MFISKVKWPGILLMSAVMVLCGHSAARAQYEELTTPQKKEEKDLMARNKVQVQRIYQRVSGEMTPQRNRFFDDKGNLLLDYQFARRTYYIWDQATGMPSYIMDSVLNIQGMDVKEMDDKPAAQYWTVNYVALSYTAEKRLKSIVWNNQYRADFTWNAKTRTLHEKKTTSLGDMEGTYKYNAAGQLILGQEKDAAGHVLYRHTKKITPSGVIILETTTKFAEDYRDSVQTVYGYDGGRVFKISEFAYTSTAISLEDSPHPEMLRDHNETRELTMTFDKQGQVVSTLSTNSLDPKFNRYTTFKYDKNGLMTESTEALGKLAPTVYSYSYITR